MNCCIEKGRLAKDPDIKYTKDNLALANFTIAVPREKKDAGCDWVKCVAFGKQAELMEKYFHKGSEICVRGRWRTDTFTDKNGQKQYADKLSVEIIEFCGNKADNQTPQETAQPTLDDMMASDIDDAIPFN